MTGIPTGRPDAYNFANPALPKGQQTDNAGSTRVRCSPTATAAIARRPDEPVVWAQLPNSYSLRSYDDRFPNIRNPWATQVNMSLFKNFKIRERMNFQLRGEAFNAFNTPIYQGPDTGSVLQ